jgi:ABC-2 type transport system ATP-binding protein
VASTEAELKELETQFHVISTQLVGGKHEVRVHAETSPGTGFRPVDSSLEDVYFLNLPRHAAAQAGS